jgi:hypothetical protein
VIPHPVADLHGPKKQEKQHEKNATYCKDKSVETLLTNELAAQGISRQPNKAAGSVGDDVGDV